MLAAAEQVGEVRLERVEVRLDAGADHDAVGSTGWVYDPFPCRAQTALKKPRFVKSHMLLSPQERSPFDSDRCQGLGSL